MSASACCGKIRAMKSTSIVDLGIPCIDDATEPPIRYGIRNCTSAVETSLTIAVSSSPRITWKFVAINLAKQFLTESHPRHSKEDLPVIGVGMALAHTCFRHSTDRRRP